MWIDDTLAESGGATIEPLMPLLNFFNGLRMI